LGKKSSIVAILGACLQAGHEVKIPPARRHDHIPENEPVKPIDFGVNLIFAASTSGFQSQSQVVKIK
jgi:hypothetical protein